MVVCASSQYSWVIERSEELSFTWKASICHDPTQTTLNFYGNSKW